MRSLCCTPPTELYFAFRKGECDQYSTYWGANMPDQRTELSFERTVCDCSACKINCKFIPVFLLTSDIRRIAEHLGYGNPVEFALDNLLASPGAIVVDHGQIRRIRTLTPARRQDGAWLFLDEEYRCRIHSVSPYGCSHFDGRQTNEEADLRSSAGHYHLSCC